MFLKSFKDWVSQGAKKNNQHVDFPSGHPPEYYPRLSLVNFAERTGCSSFRLIWPIMKILYQHTTTNIFYLSHTFSHHHSIHYQSSL